MLVLADFHSTICLLQAFIQIDLSCLFPLQGIVSVQEQIIVNLC